LFELLHHIEGNLRSLFIAQAMEEMMEELQDSPAGRLHLGIALLDSLLQVRNLLFVPIRLLDRHLDAIKTLAIRNHGGHDGLILRQTPLDALAGLLHAPKTPSCMSPRLGFSASPHTCTSWIPCSVLFGLRINPVTYRLTCANPS